MYYYRLQINWVFLTKKNLLLISKNFSYWSYTTFTSFHSRGLSWGFIIPHYILERRLTWHVYWLLGRKSTLSRSNKRHIYKTILKPIWTCCIQLWGTASTSNIQILDRFQSKALRMIVDAPWYVPNTVILRDLQTPTFKEKIRRYSSQYSARLSAHPNDVIVSLTELPDNRRLRRHLSNDLPARFLV
jgi:hypothetical protein